ncbi:MAG TPA: putative 4-hydroxy-4-methyl-2-oxoglutarate aldolase [Spongiibacteraceae bacterium]|nr:ribonuclease activity regulator protein RraA [Spongiibacteraceae bacterium]MBN51824.1 ribonuclease activity regulator protein RraA [Spongiibacteraceae bacterium]HCS27759.1 putative 4-hydroxy-4-methyl-2-oxoglutarate aldolase [Spongiibacteraceae bacterium]|tara:strand:+ start:2167 stop:2676 length:510 start_codon:yes stop_codon:yes gene_type:complete
MTTISTPDLCDAYGDKVQVADPVFRHFGGIENFYGEIATVKCFEDNSKVGESLRCNGNGKVLVVDGGGSQRRSLLGDKLVRMALDNGWKGIIVYGYIRDLEDIAEMGIGVMAMGSIPRKTEKRGEGRTGVNLQFASLNCKPGNFIYADKTGIIVSTEALALTDISETAA